MGVDASEGEVQGAFGERDHRALNSLAATRLFKRSDGLSIDRQRDLGWVVQITRGPKGEVCGPGIDGQGDVQGGVLTSPARCRRWCLLAVLETRSVATGRRP